MNKGFYQVMARGMTMLTMASLVVVPTSLQAGPPGLSANPGKRIIFPAKGQTAEQQKQDESDAYDWATGQTGWDPYRAYDKLVDTGYVAAETANAAKGGAVKKAAAGALLGVTIGSIAGDPGKGAAIGAAAGGLTGGARSRRTRKAAGNSQDAAVEAYKQQFALWESNFMAAMEGKGYTVK